MTLHVHLHIFYVEEALPTQIAQMIFDLLMHCLDVNIELGFIVEVFTTLNAETNFLAIDLMHRQNVGFERILSRRKEVAVLHPARKLLT